MQFTPENIPLLIDAIAETLAQNAEQVTTLDQVLGDGDHLINLQRGLNALKQQSAEIAELDWKAALQKIGMVLLTTMGGASGSLLGTLFISMSKALDDKKVLNQQIFSDIFTLGVEAVKKRGKAEAGEKTLLDVLIPVSECIKDEVKALVTVSELLEKVTQSAIEGMESTRNMVATKGRASYLQEKSVGHIDAGARTSQLMICAIADVLTKKDSC